jgi:hypothetical protein
MNINVYIERLILDGLPITHRERPMLQAAVEAELVRLLSLDRLAPYLLTGGAIPRMSGGSIQPSSDGNPDILGQQIAQAVYGEIGGSRK